MSVCPECNLPNDNDDPNCEKCKKRYHWLCTHLEKYDIKLHKQNPYKTWRCPTCIDKFCKNCDQIFPDNYQESIECAKCQNWYHFHCSDLTVDEFFSYLPENSDDWLCKKCVEKMCKKCGKNIYKQNKIKCSNCQFCFHSNSCAKIPKNEKNSLSSKSWLCQKCLHIVYPFSGINDEEIFNLSAHKLEKFSIKNLSTDLYSNSCNVCKKSVKADKHVPCTTCKCKIHIKCSKLKNVKQNFHIHKGKWKCDVCVNNYTEKMSEILPFISLDLNSLLETTFNSINIFDKHFLPEVIIEDKLKLMLSYSKQSPWYDYTHPHDKDHDFFSTDIDDTNFSIRRNFDYYDVDTFRNRSSLWDKSKSLSIVHTNICSLQANIDHLEDLIHDMDHSFDIIALTETWNPEGKQKDFSPKRLEGYLDYCGTGGSSLKGGCGFYIKETFTPIPRKDLEFKISEPDKQTESCWLELVNEGGPNVLVGVIYRHPSRNNHLFQEKLKCVLKKVNKEKKKAIICGDFNLNLLNFEHDKQVSSFLNSMFQNNFQPCITEPTRITNANKPSLVDNIFINSFDDPICGNILEHISYDHLPNFVVLNHNHKNKKHTLKKRDKKNFDPVKFQAELLDNGNLLLELINAESAQAACNLYMEKYLIKLDEMSPLKDLSKKERKIADKPWLTTGLLKSISKKRSLFKQFKADKFKNKSSDVYKKYKYHNDQICKLKRISKAIHDKKYFIDNMKNSKKMWIGLNTLLNRNKKQQNTIYLEDQGFISDPHNVANKFNDFFLNVAGNLSAKIVQKNTKFQDYLKNPNKSKFSLKETEPGEVVKVINNLDSKKSGDIYNISPDLVKLSNQAISQCLSIIFNRCIKDGCFPNAFKNTKVIPLHKGDSVLSVSNYRPISLLPIFSKIFERLIYNQFIVYINENKILDELQFGFQKNKSTEHAISAIVNKITSAKIKKFSSYCIFLDFAKAFDTVNHSILLDKLKYYGITEGTLDLFRSYLSKREQVVEVNGVLSDWGTIKHGVPQGSILGPLLFLLYINDISKSSNILQFFLFADDTTVFYSADPNDPNTEKILNEELEKVSGWLAANKLSLNVKKSNFLHFHQGKSAKITIKLKINNTLVEEKDSTKYLGTFLDNKLDWKIQIQHIKSKISRGIGIISKIRHSIGDACLNLYHSFVQSYLNYNILNWSCTHKSSLEPIEKKIKKAIRLISFTKTKVDHTAPLFKKHNILPFYEHIQHRRASFMWKMHNGYIQNPLNTIFTKNLQNDQKYVLPLPKTEKDKNSFEYTCVRAWNLVPEAIRNSSTLNSFKYNYKRHLLGYPPSKVNRIFPNQQYNVNRNHIQNPIQRGPFQSRWDLEIGQATNLI